MRDSIFTPQPVTPFVACPNCKRLVRYGTEQCPACREEIDEQYARLSATIIVLNTQACSLANTLKSGEPAVVIFFAVSVFVFFTGGAPLLLSGLLSPLVYILGIIFWFIRYRKFRFGDEDFARARRDLSRSLKLWSALVLVQILLTAYFLKNH